MAIDAALERSSYDEFVQDPIRPHFISVGQPSDLALSFISFTGVARSGVNGPLICGISESKSISITSSKYFSGLSYTSWSALRSSLIFEAALTTSSLSVDFKYLSIDSSYANIDVVAPTSAPILQIVPFPVHERDSAPSPKYSSIYPVPPLTVKIPATFKITSLAEAQPFNLPVSFIPINFGNFNSHGIPAITSTASAPPTPMATIPNPPAFTVCESVPIIMPPGKA